VAADNMSITMTTSRTRNALSTGASRR
jgi:hypothetical protein